MWSHHRRPSAGKLGSCWPLLALLGLLSCAPEYELLRSSETGGSGGTGQGPSTGGEAAASQTAGTSSAATDSGGGSVGGTDSGGSPFGGAESGGSAGGPSGFGGTSTGGLGGTDGAAGNSGGRAGGSGCMRHDECGLGNVCTDYACVACPSAPAACPGPCSNGFQPMMLERNGCAVCECVPPSECSANGDCPSGEVCYAGAQCRHGCTEADCCFGNQCSPVGCAAAPATSCLEVGCSGGGVCLAACASTSCECDGSAWQCVSSASGGGAADSCPQACAAP